MNAASEILQDAYAGKLPTISPVQLLCRFTVDQAAEYCGVSSHTFRRWRLDRRPSFTAQRLLAVRAGYLPWPGWDNWQMDGGLLFPPGFTGHGYSAGEVLALPYLHALRAELERELFRLRSKLADLSQDPLPRLAATSGGAL